MEELVEGGFEITDHLVDKHFDKLWDKGADRINRRKSKQGKDSDPRSNNQKRGSKDSYNSSSSQKRTPAAEKPSADARGGARNLTGTAAGGAALGATTATAAYPGSRRKQRNQLPSPERDIDSPDYRRDSINNLRQESATSDRVLREYESEVDDPRRKPESVLSSKDLRSIQEEERRDSGMASGYNDNYRQDGYGGGGASRPRSQPPRSKYYDDDDSDYDERSGRRYSKGNGRGYDDDDDRDYDYIVKETERYRGPRVERRESCRSGNDGPYGAGAVTQYGRRSDGALDRQGGGESRVSRRTKSRGRDNDRDRSYSRSRSRSSSRGGGIQEKIENAFDTSGRGLGVGIAGAVIGGLAGRQFGQKHRERDILIGAVVGGLGANLAENKWREFKDNKERDVRDDERRWENKWDGRSRSNVR